MASPCEGLVSGRNPLDWQHPTWHGREKEVLDLALPPFSAAEVRLYLERELANLFNASASDETAVAASGAEQTASTAESESQARSIERLYELTAGRPILVGLACDLLARGLLTLREFGGLPSRAF